MADLGNFNVTDVEAITSPYENALYHRTSFVEGIRKIAFRNMMHLARAIEECKTEETTNEDHTSAIQDRMLADQGMETGDGARKLLGATTFEPMKVYLSLLYASLEFYKNIRKKLPIYQDPEMDRCLDRQADFVEKLKLLRDAFLHPSMDSGMRQQAFSIVELSYKDAPECQIAFDRYLARVRSRVEAEVGRRLLTLPKAQCDYCIWKSLFLTGFRMKIFMDETGFERCVANRHEIEASWQQPSDGFRSWVPSKKQQQIAGRLARCIYDITPSDPELVYPLQEDDQTPMPVHPNLAVALVAAGEGPTVELDRSNRHEAHLLNSKEYFGRLLWSVDVLFNESLNNFEIRTRTSEAAPDAILNRIHGRGRQYAQEMVAPSRVLAAMLYEPLRAYSNAAGANPTLRDEVIHRYVSVPGRLKELRDFRNSVFHVISKPIHPEVMDLAGVPGHDVLRDPAFFGRLKRVLGYQPGRGPLP